MVNFSLNRSYLRVGLYKLKNFVYSKNDNF